MEATGREGEKMRRAECQSGGNRKRISDELRCRENARRTETSLVGVTWRGRKATHGGVAGEVGQGREKSPGPEESGCWKFLNRKSRRPLPLSL